MKKVLSILLVVLIVSLSLPTNYVSAHSLKNSDKVDFITEYLTNLVNGDLDTAFSMMEDSRKVIDSNYDMSKLSKEEKNYLSDI